jgi:RHH-type proline utilization regulon transcriptional repressor/proline dehydrogenase/delta 1-pyrroline-5-carboxylate dehydrogenase
MREAGRMVWQRELPPGCERGTFVAPDIVEIDSIADLTAENFGPVLHVARFAAGELERVIEAINATGYGLTLGLHSRIDMTRRLVESRAPRATSMSTATRSVRSSAASRSAARGFRAPAQGRRAELRGALRHRAGDDDRHHGRGGNASLLAGG